MNAWHIAMLDELTSEFYHDHRRALLTIARFSGINLKHLAFMLSY